MWKLLGEVLRLLLIGVLATTATILVLLGLLWVLGR